MGFRVQCSGSVGGLISVQGLGFEGPGATQGYVLGSEKSEQ